MEIVILAAPSDVLAAKGLLSSLTKDGMTCRALKVQPYWDSETKNPLEFRIRRASHVLLVVSRESVSSTWLAFVSGWCLGNNRELALFRIDSSIFVPGFLSGLPSFDAIAAVAHYYESRRAEWLVKEERDQARTSLLEIGIPFRSESLANCCQEGDVKAVELFLKAGMIADMRDRAGVTLLGLAVRNHHAVIAELLVSRGASLDLQSEDRGYSALMDAVAAGNGDLSDFLLKRGANPNLVSKDGQSALIIGVGRNDVPVCRKLLEYGADPNQTDKLGFSARKYAGLFHNPEMMELFK